MTIETKITSLIEEPLDSLGYELVRVKQIGSDTLQIMIDSDAGINIEDCTKATRLINRILQVEEVSFDYNLEVSSPGMDRPLTKKQHYLKLIGKDIKLTTQIPIDGQKKFAGKLTNFNNETDVIELTCDNKVVEIKLEQVQSANLHYKNITKG